MSIHYSGWEVIFKEPSRWADPLDHPIMHYQLGVKKGGTGLWVNLEQIVILMLQWAGENIEDYKPRETETVFEIKGVVPVIDEEELKD